MSDIFISKQLGYLNRICELHGRIKYLNESLTKLYPVAVVNGDHYIVFDINKQKGGYEFIMKHPTHFPISFDIQAAFSLGFYENKIAAILTEKTLEDLDEHIMVFHEFVHCHQWCKCETSA